MTLRPKRVLFVCVGNSGRSQIAAALFNLIADPNLAVATSAVSMQRRAFSRRS